jgi:hypothetical protein
VPQRSTKSAALAVAGPPIVVNTSPQTLGQFGTRSAHEPKHPATIWSSRLQMLAPYPLGI